VTTYVGLLRGVNLAGGSTVRMADLVRVVGEVGYPGARTWIQSGNVVFSGSARPPSTIERQLEERLRRDLGLETELFVRTATEWGEIVSRNPFPAMAARDPAHLVVLALKSAPNPAAWAALPGAIRGREEVRPGDRHAYLTYPDGIGRSKLTTAVLDRVLGSHGTARNWNTVTKLASMATDATP
jgi:uncharacterized protein (DUF1697 family)